MGSISRRHRNVQKCKYEAVEKFVSRARSSLLSSNAELKSSTSTLPRPPLPRPPCSHPHRPPEALPGRAAAGPDDPEHRQAGAGAHQAAAALRPGRRGGQTVPALRSGPYQTERARPVHFPGIQTRRQRTNVKIDQRCKK